MNRMTDKAVNGESATANSGETEELHFPVEIVFRHMPRSAEITNTVLQKAIKLQRLHERISECHVVIDATASQKKGNTYQVGIRLVMPGQKILAAHSSDKNTSHVDLHAAVRDVFSDIRRQIKKQLGRKNNVRPKTPPLTPREGDPES